MKPLLIITAALETATGLALLTAPSWLASVLLGSTLEDPGALTVGRVAGASLLAFGVACWVARSNGRPAVVAMTLYHIAVAAVLAHSAWGLGLSATALWPTVTLHALLAGWCISCLRQRRSSGAYVLYPLK